LHRTPEHGQQLIFCRAHVIKKHESVEDWSGLALLREGLSWSFACCGPSITADGRPDGERKNVFCRGTYKMYYYFSFSPSSRPSVVMDGQHHAKDWMVLRSKEPIRFRWRLLMCLLFNISCNKISCGRGCRDL